MNASRTQIRLTLIVAVCAAQFYNSARDIVDVALPIVHGDVSRAAMFPASVDLMILVAALTVAAPKGVNRKAKFWAAAGRYIGFGFTVYANVLASGISRVNVITPSVFADAVFMLAPALALICTMELAIHGAQGTPATRAARTTVTKDVPRQGLRSVKTG